jgi:hypothetical protein
MMLSSSEQQPSSDHKSSYLVENHGEKVKELVYYVRVAKSTALLLVFAVLVNFVLMYGLIRYPCSPSPARCAAYCATLENAPRVVGASPKMMGTPR